MKIDEFVNSLKMGEKPENLPIEIQALWIERNGNWRNAHELVQALETKEAFWVHAYLHHREEDIGNAQYWYNRAEKKMPDISLDDEWRQIAENLLAKLNT